MMRLENNCYEIDGSLRNKLGHKMKEERRKTSRYNLQVTESSSLQMLYYRQIQRPFMPTVEQVEDDIRKYECI